MNKRLFSIIALIVALMLVVLTGCEKEVPKNDGDGTTSTSVITTETTEAVTENPISMDRVNNAMLNNNIDANVGATTPVTGENSGSGGDNAGTTEGGSSDGGNSGSGAVVEVQDDEAVIKSGTYYVKCKADMGNGIIPMELAVKGERIYMYVDSPDGAMAIVVKPDGAFFLIPATKLCLVVDQAFLESQGMNTDELFDSIQLGDHNEAPVSEYQETVDGIVYDVKEYDSGNKVYLIGKTMIMSVSSDGSTIYYQDILTEVPDSLFEPPSDYEVMAYDE